VTVDGESGEMRNQRLPGTTSDVVAFCASLPGPTRAAYEAGPTGYGLARALEGVGIGCVVAAPGKIERPAQDRVKTDQRDAARLVRLLMIGGLHAVRVPSIDEETLRDLVRAREDLRGDLMRARQRLGKLLVAAGVRSSRSSVATLAGVPTVAVRPVQAVALTATGPIGARPGRCRGQHTGAECPLWSKLRLPYAFPCGPSSPAPASSPPPPAF